MLPSSSMLQDCMLEKCTLICTASITLIHNLNTQNRSEVCVERWAQERMLDGVVKGQYSLGWALLPLFKVCSAMFFSAAPE